MILKSITKSSFRDPTIVLWSTDIPKSCRLGNTLFRAAPLPCVDIPLSIYVHRWQYQGPVNYTHKTSKHTLEPLSSITLTVCPIETLSGYQITYSGTPYTVMFAARAIISRPISLISASKTSHFRRLSIQITKKDLITGGYASRLSFTGGKKVPILNPPAITALIDVLSQLAIEPNLRALFIRSTISGADLKYMKNIPDAGTANGFITLIERLCSSVQKFPVPVIAICDGPCLGAGMEVAASCDVRIAVESEKTCFGMPETKVGIPSVVQANLLPGLIGWTRARELLYFGEVIDATTALKWGFLNTVVEEKDLGREIEKWERRVDLTGPKALSAQKALMKVSKEKLPVSNREVSNCPV
jgi:enoyl-CoA hydratase